jgi:hypothetical protein
VRLVPALIVVVSLLSLPSSAGAIAIVSGPPAVTNMTTAMFTFQLEELEAPYTSYQCQIDLGAPVSPCGPSYTAPGQLAAGMHEFTVTGFNNGVADPNSAAHHLWTIDLTAPTVTITAGPSGETTARSATFELSSNEPGSTFQCSIDGSTRSPCFTPATYTGLTVRNHTLRVITVDPAGNQSAEVARTWTIRADNTPPDTTITAAPSGLNNLAEPAVEFIANEAGSFQCSVNGGAFGTCASPRILSALIDGAITFRVRAVDLAENLDPTPATAEWTRDTAPPPSPALFIGRRARAAQNATATTAIFHTSTQLRAVWDRAPDAPASEVEYRSTPAGVDPGVGKWMPWLQRVTTMQADTTIATGTTGCIRARSVDAAGNGSAWTVRCTTLPYRASSATVTHPFRKRTGSGYFAGQYVRYAGSGQTRGSLRLRITPAGTGAEVKQISLVATTCRRCGTVRVVVTGDGTPPVSESDIVASRTLSLRSSRTRRTRVLSAIGFDDVLPRLERRYVYVFAAGRRGDRRIEGIAVSAL